MDKNLGLLHAVCNRMKKILVILILVATLIYCLRHATNVPDKNVAAPSPTITPSGGTDYFKRPLDRTHEVIDQVKKQRREDNY